MSSGPGPGTRTWGSTCIGADLWTQTLGLGPRDPDLEARTWGPLNGEVHLAGFCVTPGLGCGTWGSELCCGYPWAAAVFFCKFPMSSAWKNAMRSMNRCVAFVHSAHSKKVMTTLEGILSGHTVIHHVESS